MRRARSAGMRSRRDTMRRTVAVSPAADAVSKATVWRSAARSCCGPGPKIRRNMAGVYAVAMTVLFRDVRLIDGVSHEAQEHMDVRLDGERIGAVEPHAASRAVAPGTTVVEGTGRTLLPGLIDAHAHYTFDPTEGSLQTIARRDDETILAGARRHAALALRAGVTTARGAGSIRGLELLLRDEIRAGRTPGPRIVAAGAAVGSVGGHGSAFGLEAAGPEGLAIVTRQVIERGADVVAGDAGRRVMSHAQDGESVRRSVAAGVASVEHAWLADEAAIHALA